MERAPYAEDRLKLEEIIVRADRTGAEKDIDLAIRAMARFHQKWPEACESVAAFNHSLETARAQQRKP
jgi:hypothetical protein